MKPAGTGLKERIRVDAPLLGTFLQIATPSMVEVLGRAGLDFAVVDLEHGGMVRDAMSPLIVAADSVGLPLLARVNLADLPGVGQILDIGYSGVLVAQVESQDQAQQAVNAVHYEPVGHRGACPGIRASEYGWLDWVEHQTRSNNETVLGIAVEGLEGIQAASRIASLVGVDFLFVGVFDLAKSVGHATQVEHPIVVNALKAVVETSAKYGVVVGTWAPNMAIAARWKGAGVNLITVSTDVMLWRQTCLGLTSQWQEAASLP